MDCVTPRVTIMIPTYNQANVLGMAIETALAQDYPHLEVVVADDASTDDTPALVAAYLRDPRLKYRRNERNLGRVGNYRKTLYDDATGDWALNLDGDDYLSDSTFISRAVAQVMARRAVVMVVAGVRTSDSLLPEEAFDPASATWDAHQGETFFFNWKLSTKVPHLATMYNRRLATSIGFYDNDVLYADCESLRRLCLHGVVLMHNQVAGVWRCHSNNASHGLQPDQHLANLDMILSPYRYARERGLDPVKLERWRDANLGEYIQRYIHRCIESQRLDYAAGFLDKLRVQQPAIFYSVLPRLIGDGRAIFKVLLLTVGGNQLMEWAITSWHRRSSQAIAP